MTREEVASDELRTIVARWKDKGIPATLPVNEVMAKMTGDQHEIMRQVFDATEKERKVGAKGDLPKEGSDWYNICMEIRSGIQSAIVAGLADAGLGLILRHMENYGAIPMADPKVEGKEWMYFLRCDGAYVCWECGSIILQKQVNHPVWYREGPGPCAGSGEVRGELVPYCPKCDPEPKDCPVVVSEADEIVDEIAAALDHPGLYK